MGIQGTVERKFVSIQPVVVADGVALIAVADDGSAWTAKSYCNSGYLNPEDLEWRPLTALPKGKSTAHPFVGR